MNTLQHPDFEHPFVLTEEIKQRLLPIRCTITSPRFHIAVWLYSLIEQYDLKWLTDLDFVPRFDQTAHMFFNRNYLISTHPDALICDGGLLDVFERNKQLFVLQNNFVVGQEDIEFNPEEEDNDLETAPNARLDAIKHIVVPLYNLSHSDNVHSILKMSTNPSSSSCNNNNNNNNTSTPSSSSCNNNNSTTSISSIATTGTSLNNLLQKTNCNCLTRLATSRYNNGEWFAAVVERETVLQQTAAEQTKLLELQRARVRFQQKLNQDFNFDFGGAMREFEVRWDANEAQRKANDELIVKELIQDAHHHDCYASEYHNKYYPLHTILSINSHLITEKGGACKNIDQDNDIGNNNTNNNNTTTTNNNNTTSLQNVVILTPVEYTPEECALCIRNNDITNPTWDSVDYYQTKLSYQIQTTFNIIKSILTCRSPSINNQYKQENDINSIILPTHPIWNPSSSIQDNNNNNNNNNNNQNTQTNQTTSKSTSIPSAIHHDFLNVEYNILVCNEDGLGPTLVDAFHRLHFTPLAVPSIDSDGEDDDIDDDILCVDDGDNNGDDDEDDYDEDDDDDNIGNNDGTNNEQKPIRFDGVPVYTAGKTRKTDFIDDNPLYDIENEDNGDNNGEKLNNNIWFKNGIYKDISTLEEHPIHIVVGDINDDDDLWDERGLASYLSFGSQLDRYIKLCEYIKVKKTLYTKNGLKNKLNKINQLQQYIQRLNKHLIIIAYNTNNSFDQIPERDFMSNWPEHAKKQRQKYHQSAIDANQIKIVERIELFYRLFIDFQEILNITTAFYPLNISPRVPQNNKNGNVVINTYNDNPNDVDNYEILPQSNLQDNNNNNNNSDQDEDNEGRNNIDQQQTQQPTAYGEVLDIDAIKRGEYDNNNNNNNKTTTLTTTASPTNHIKKNKMLNQTNNNNNSTTPLVGSTPVVTGMIRTPVLPSPNRSRAKWDPDEDPFLLSPVTSLQQNSQQSQQDINSMKDDTTTNNTNPENVNSNNNSSWDSNNNNNNPENNNNNNSNNNDEDGVTDLFKPELHHQPSNEEPPHRDVSQSHLPQRSQSRRITFSSNKYHHTSNKNQHYDDMDDYMNGEVDLRPGLPNIPSVQYEEEEEEGEKDEDNNNNNTKINEQNNTNHNQPTDGTLPILNTIDNTHPNEILAREVLSIIRKHLILYYLSYQSSLKQKSITLKQIQQNQTTTKKHKQD